MNLNITTRDFKFFALGIFAFFLFETIYDWEENKQSFIDGWNSYEEKE